MQQSIARQVEIALGEADVVVCVLDATSSPTSVDSAEMALLRETKKPVIYLANKTDSDRLQAEAHDLYRLGMDQLLFASALHGRGIRELEEALVAALDAAPHEGDELPTEPGGELRVAVVGRPNAGKSSLINRLLGESRLLVDARPGTTRDTIDSLLTRRGKHYRLVDTAGLRRKGRVAKSRDAVEAMSVVAAIRALQRAEIALVVCDAKRGVEEQDAKIAGLALEHGRGVVVALNKIDLLGREASRQAEKQARETLSFMPWAPMMRLSAKTGRGVGRMIERLSRVRRAFDKRIATGELNRFFETVLARNPPPTQGGRAPRFYYITQAKVRPPTFMVVTSHPDNLHFSYQRYVSNQIRAAFGFEGVPIRVHYRRKGRRPKKRR